MGVVVMVTMFTVVLHETAPVLEIAALEPMLSTRKINSVDCITIALLRMLARACPLGVVISIVIVSIIISRHNHHHHHQQHTHTALHLFEKCLCVRLEDVVGDGADEEMVMVIVVMRIMMADRLDCTATATTTTTTAAAAVADQLQFPQAEQ